MSPIAGGRTRPIAGDRVSPIEGDRTNPIAGDRMSPIAEGRTSWTSPWRSGNSRADRQDDDGMEHATACPYWPEFPPAALLSEGRGQDQDRIRLERLQAAFVSDPREAS